MENNELQYFQVLKRIANYEDADWLRRNAEKQYGCSFEEALEMAYDNVLGEVQAAVRGKRAPVSREAVSTGTNHQTAQRRKTETNFMTPEKCLYKRCPDPDLCVQAMDCRLPLDKHKSSSNSDVRDNPDTVNPEGTTKR